MKRMLFILAGYPWVGKTTLLINALKKGIPIFGERYDALFQETKVPVTFPEWAIDPKETLARGSWFSDNHIPFLSQLGELPEHVVLHVDLAALVGPLSESQEFPPGMRALLPRTLENLADDAHNELFFRHALSKGFFRKFDHVIVNTLIAPWETLAARWQRKGSKHNRKQGLFDFKRPRIDIYRSIYDSWLRAVSTLDPDLALMTEIKEGRLSIKALRQGSKAENIGGFGIGQ
jgi:hypothetical protein